MTRCHAASFSKKETIIKNKIRNSVFVVLQNENRHTEYFTQYFYRCF